MSRVLIIGGAGLLGTHLASVLSRTKHEVALCDSFLGSVRYRTPDKYRIFVANAMDANTMQHPINVFRPEIIILAAAYYYPRDIVYKVFEETRLVLDSANVLCSVIGQEDQEVKHIYFCSSNEVYGGPQSNKPLAETRKIVRSTTLPGTAQLAAEKLLGYRCAEIGIPFTALRVFDMYGPRVMFSVRTGLLSSIIESFLRGERIGLSGPRCLRDFIHVEDVARAFGAIIKSGYAGTVNVGTGEGTSLIKLVKSLRKHMEIIEPPEALPNNSLKSFSSVASTKLLDSILPSGWTPKHTLEDDLATMVEFRKKELSFATRSNPVSLLNAMRGL